jgi:hypothetical protein
MLEQTEETDQYNDLKFLSYEYSKTLYMHKKFDNSSHSFYFQPLNSRSLALTIVALLVP